MQNQTLLTGHCFRVLISSHDHRYATPATVSRAGILYISTDSGFQVCVELLVCMLWDRSTVMLS